MDNVQELLPLITNLPTLEELKAAAGEQIAVLSQQRAKLDGISTDLQKLIEAYNAQKSLLGHAAHWYGEQIWWLKIIVSIIAAGIAILLYIPFIISIALSFTISFVLIDHHAVATIRDRLITDDLVAQNNSVQEMLGLLNGTRENLEHGLAVLCRMNQEMGLENLKLRDNVESITQQVEEYSAINVSLNKTIENLQANEAHLTLQLVTLSEELRKYESMIADGSSSFAEESQAFKATTASLEEDGRQLQLVAQTLSHYVGRFPDMTGSVLSSNNSSPADQHKQQEATNSALRDSQKLLQEIDDIDLTDDYLSSLESQTQALSPPRRTGLNIPGNL
ncbi:MAG: hypothetical protein KBB94_07590 [Legionellaceae bacterium]|nr:hypothetical protein [Legionellaceae bacterium]MBP9775526.1 hypothetical protein [Legionellaceae bacterium]